MRRLVLALLASCVPTVPVSEPAPEGDLPIEPRFQPLVDQIERERAALGVTGVSVLVMERGEITFAHGFGAKKPGGAAVDAGTLFRIGSVTKVLTTAAVLAQVDDGKLTLDARVTDLLPTFHLSRSTTEQAITVRHLLTHESALDDHLGPGGGVDLADHSDAALASYTAGGYVNTGYQMAPAGRMWNYSNPNFTLAGLISETLDGKPYREVLEDRVFAPLEMNRTLFRGEDVIADGNFADGVVGGRAEPPDTYDNPWGRPAGFAFSSVYDVAKFARFLLDGDGDVLSEQQRLAMQSPQVDMQFLGNLNAYGFGLFVDDGHFSQAGFHPTPIVHHGGDLNGFSADLITVPSTDFALIVLANGDYSHFVETHSFALRQYGGIAAPVTPPDLRADVSTFPALAGTYQDNFGLGRVVITANQLDLGISLPDLDAQGVPYSRTLAPLWQDNFAFTIDGYETQVTFLRDAAGRGEYMRERFFVAKRAASAKPTPIDRAALRSKLLESSRLRRPYVHR